MIDKQLREDFLNALQQIDCITSSWRKHHAIIFKWKKIANLTTLTHQLNLTHIELQNISNYIVQSGN